MLATHLFRLSIKKVNVTGVRSSKWADSSSVGLSSLARKNGKFTMKREENSAGLWSNSPLISKNSVHSICNFPNKENVFLCFLQQLVAPCLPLESSGEVHSFLLHFQFSKLQSLILIGTREYGQDFLIEIVSSKFSNEFNALVFEVLFLIHSEFP